MPPLKAFVAKSFASIDGEKTRKIENVLDGFRPLGLTWETAEQAEIESVSQKVRKKIDDCDIFVGIFTRRYPIFSADVENGLSPQPSGVAPIAWTGPPWLFQESGYALRAGKKLMLFREIGVALPGLQGDLEYIPYDPSEPESAWVKALEILTRLTAQNAGIEVGTTVSIPEPAQAGDGDNEAVTSVAVPKRSEYSPFASYIDALVDAEFAGDADGIDRAEQAGLELIRTGAADVDEVFWRSWCLVSRAKIGLSGTVSQLQKFSSEHPTHPAPYNALAAVATIFGEHRHAGNWHLKAAEAQPENVTHRIAAAKAFRKAREFDISRQHLKLILAGGALSDANKAAALQEMFWLYKDLGDHIAAFCVGEAALQVQPEDFHFRFQLAYAYGNARGEYMQHDYSDLALFHYRLIVRSHTDVEYARNNLGVAYRELGAPIHAVEEFKMSSDSGNALSTSNVIRQCLRSGFVADAEAWAEAHKNQSDRSGDIAQALTSVHQLRTAENEKINEVLAGEFEHRTALGALSNWLVSDSPVDIEGEWAFPVANLKLSLDDALKIVGVGESIDSGNKVLYKLAASNRGGLWRFEIKSRKESDYAWSSGAGHSYGLLGLSSDSRSLSVLEYGSTPPINAYTVARVACR